MFETIQGEGAYTGTPSIFIRLQGCPVGCPWCDTQQTWYVEEKDKISAKDMLAKQGDSPTWSTLTVAEIMLVIEQQGYHAKHVVITGGEPCMYDLTELTTVLQTAGYQCQIETSGTFEIKTHTDTWVTLSPKVNMKGKYPILDTCLARANEIKHPVATEQHIIELEALLARGDFTKLIYLQPISQKSRATEFAIKTCIEKNWRLSIQTHKYLNIS
ncbi:7-carboxy-7-deazaguanine synthase QueE [Saccharobesus litoralis]|uniref:7-carboxy-7-deazaguanine synthase n=1 Tax=Saccharobesus litoralis TaxID=2172099 RepID=A0A2S0VXA9_9ALTE|nr:7-carboxy-7-deazaguanine synthase QueE [Saccharobesus litoralis]AWB68859.1 7-carboxy-7-deazaguanine synthase QueE [Saccharobesus litoralis]